ncbi:phosphoglycerate mutase-like protein [Stipitochalara longipes BDJ]|nr:phosphoglycerate mutase-like protein [Stipitochalara longipes BDJ]
MGPHFTAIFALAATALAAEQVVWSAVTYTYHGEKTPDLFAGPYDLTPVGANQLYEVGQVYRERYITGSANSTLTNASPIYGINTYAIDNYQLQIMATDDPWVSTGAMAFMQALYPPRNALVLDLESMLANSSLAEYPLNGYQYPNIESLSILDFNHLWIAGDDDCNNYDIVNVEYLSSAAYVQKIQSTSAFYQSLSNSVFSAIPTDDLNYGNAWTLWEFAAFEYQHNETLNQSGTFTAAELDTLYNLASQQQWGFNTPDSSGTIQAMAGRTYASYVLQQFQHQIASNGSADKLTLLFGSFEPMLAFFALSDLATGPSASRFNSLPLHGSTMTLELYSYAEIPLSTSEIVPFPDDTSELWVRFLFRNGTGNSDPLIEYPLFGRGNSEDDMSWSDFVFGMGEFSLDDLVDWCSECNSGSLFCEAIMLNYNSETGVGGDTTKKAKSVSSPVAGVIGATVTIAVMLIVGAILALVGFRLDYRPREKGGVSDLGVLKRSVSGGGFKGAEKLASDTDLTMKGGAGASVVRHERVGSWELNDSPDKKQSVLDKDFESGGGMSKTTYGRRSEDAHGLGGVDPYGEPVKALDQV